jgi:hypothetical protein
VAYRYWKKQSHSTQPAYFVKLFGKRRRGLLMLQSSAEKEV